MPSPYRLRHPPAILQRLGVSHSGAGAWVPEGVCSPISVRGQGYGVGGDRAESGSDSPRGRASSTPPLAGHQHSEAIKLVAARRLDTTPQWTPSRSFLPRGC